LYDGQNFLFKTGLIVVVELWVFAENASLRLL
jgi:hypothetical protein